MDLEIEGFSATQRTIIGSGAARDRDQRIQSQGGGGGTNAMLTPYTPRAQHHRCGLCYKFCGSTQSKMDAWYNIRKQSVLRQ